MAKENTPRLAGVIGWPISHSVSPRLHRCWADREGAPAYYIPIAVEPGFEAFARAAGALSALGFRGVNVTLPHKENALRYAASASDAARAAGAANMLTFGPDGAYADNSDIAGFSGALAEVLDPAAPLGRAVVLGAGGAARAVVFALKERGCEEMIVANRTAARAEELAAAFGAKAAPWTGRQSALSGAGLVVNATSLGMKGAPPLDIDISGLADDAVVADIVYAPLETALLEAARARGLKTMDGLSMLMHQAAAPYRAWLGERAEVDAGLRAALEAALAGRA